MDRAKICEQVQLNSNVGEKKLKFKKNIKIVELLNRHRIQNILDQFKIESNIFSTITLKWDLLLL